MTLEPAIAIVATALIVAVSNNFLDLALQV